MRHYDHNLDKTGLYKGMSQKTKYSQRWQYILIYLFTYFALFAATCQDLSIVPVEKTILSNFWLFVINIRTVNQAQNETDSI